MSDLWRFVPSRCAFNRDTQIDHCEMKLTHPDRSIMVGTQARYSFGSDNTFKMTQRTLFVPERLHATRILGNSR